MKGNDMRDKTFKKIIFTFLAVTTFAYFASLAYAFTRDWDESDPIDHTLNSKWPAEIREVMVDVSERLTATFYGFSTGETLVGAKNLPFNVQGSDPGATASQIKVYSKDVSAKAELFFQDEDANVIQVTSAGSLNITAACASIYPIGSVYIATVSTNPGTLLGCGTWTAFGAGKMMVSLDSGDADFDTSEETGGSKTSSALIAHTHTKQSYEGGADSGDDNRLDGTNSDTAFGTVTTDSSGSGSSYSIMNPYIVVYMWERAS